MPEIDDGTNIKIEVPGEKRAGVYANNLVVGHNREEFILDFIMMTGTEGLLTARIITSPSHMKRVVAAVQQNLDLYERVHGPIPEFEPPLPPTPATRH